MMAPKAAAPATATEAEAPAPTAPEVPAAEEDEEAPPLEADVVMLSEDYSRQREGRKEDGLAGCSAYFI